ncbi:MAG TPA: hypothetical protein DDX72_06240 [Ruminococcaceae bacterium]|nr:hypothetical protein [Oscillospiraceae bacterium]
MSKEKRRSDDSPEKSGFSAESSAVSAEASSGTDKKKTGKPSGAPVRTAGSDPAFRRRRGDDKLTLDFDDDAGDEEERRTERIESAKGGLVFGDAFRPLTLVDDPEEETADRKPLKGVQRIIFSGGGNPNEDKKRKAEQEAKRKAEEEAKRKAEEEAKRKAEQEAKRKAKEEAKRKAEEDAKRKAEEDAKRKAEEEAKRKAEEDAKRKAEEAKRKAEEEAKRKAEEDAKRKAEQEAKRKAEEEAKRKAEEEAKRKAEEDAKRKAEEDAKRKAEQEAKRKAEKEAKLKAEEEAKRQSGEEAKKLAEKKDNKAETNKSAVNNDDKKAERKTAEKDKNEAQKKEPVAARAVTAAFVAATEAARPAAQKKKAGKQPEKYHDDGEPEDEEIEAEIAAAVKAVIAEKNDPESAAKSAEKRAEKKKKQKQKESDSAPTKPIFSIANIVYTATIFGAAVAAFIFLPRSGISESEQRMLAAFPEFSAGDVANGKYTNGITEYFNDNVPFREELKHAALQVRNLFGISYNNAEMIGPAVAVTEEPEEEPVPDETVPPVQTAIPEMSAAITEEPEAVQETSVPGETAAPETTAPEVTAAQTSSVTHPNEIAEGVITNGQVVTKLEDGHWWGISLFGGGSGTKYADALNRFKKAVGDDVNVYNMVVPTSGEYYLPDIYNAYNASHRKSIDSINEKLEGVIPVPAIDALAAHASENIYLRTDHHWQPLGAYYAAKCFAETAGVPFADISTMEKVDVEGYMGTMSGFTKSANLIGDPEIFTYYKPSNNYTTYYYDTAYRFDYSLPFFVKMPVSSSYSMFMGGDKKIVRISTDAGTGRKLVVFKDSYGNAEIPFYFGSFDEVYVCDMRYFDLNAADFVKFTGATDLLFTMCTFSAVGPNANGLDIALSNPSSVISEGAVG